MLNDNGKSQYTFCSVNGKSNVDYLLLNFIDFGTLSNFEILEQNEHSDHNPLLFSLFRKSCDSRQMPSALEYDDSYTKIVWEDSKLDKFHAQLMNIHNDLNRLANQASREPVYEWLMNLLILCIELLSISMEGLSLVKHKTIIINKIRNGLIKVVTIQKGI